MKKRYTFLPENWFYSFLIFVCPIFSINVSAQTAPAIRWDKTFGGSGQEWLHAIQQTSDGGYIMGGWSASGIGGDKSQPCQGIRDYWIVKVDASGNKIWDKTFGGSGEDRLKSLQQTSDGGYILGGWSDSGISGDKSQASKGGLDYWVVKLDSSGNKLWDKSFGGNKADVLNSLRQTSDGGYILGGSSGSDIGGDKSQACQGSFDYWVVKLDSSGNKMWDKTFGGNDYDYLTSLQQTSDGGYILGGDSYSGISGDKSQTNKGIPSSCDYWVIKLDASGNKIWDKVIGGSKFDQLYSLQLTSDGGYILGGTSDSGIGGDKSQPWFGSMDYWVVKLDSIGNKLWDKTFGGSGEDRLTSLQQTSDGGYVVGGFSWMPHWEWYVLKLDASGNALWNKILGGNGNDIFTSLQQTTDGGYILGGYTASGISGDKSQASKGGDDYWIVKLSGAISGIKETEATFNVSISPNPNQGKFTLQLSNLTAPKADVTVSDLLGRVVLQQQLTVSNKQISKELILPYAKGMYLLQVKVCEQIITRKVVVE